jgi:hypothetical protein
MLDPGGDICGAVRLAQRGFLLEAPELARIASA